MRITSIRAYHPTTATEPTDWRHSLGQFVVGVLTDGGVRGIGVGGGGPAGVAVVEAVLAPLLIGEAIESVGDVERLWERMYHATLAFGRKGLAIMAISAADLALWDALAHEAGVSIAKLLGGELRERGARDASHGVPTTVSCYSTTREPERSVAAGFKAIKLPLAALGYDAALKRVASVRAQVGPDVQIMVDAWGQWSLDQSLRAAKTLADLNVAWLEEPLPPDDMEGYATLSRESPVPIAGGEHEYTVHGFRDLAQHGAHAIWQPDVCWTGGLTQLRAIYALAAEHGVRVVPHRGAEAWSVHAIAAINSEPLAESGREWLTWLTGQPEISNGSVTVPDRPGFGVDVSAEASAQIFG